MAPLSVQMHTFVGVIALMALMACSVTPPEGRFDCDVDSDCPDGWSCEVAPSSGPGERRCYSQPADGGVDAADTSMDVPPTDSGADAPPDARDGGPDAGPLLITFGGLGIDEAEDIAIDGDGNLYVVGSFQNSVDFGDGVRMSGGALDAFVVSFTADGTHRWDRTFGNTGTEALLGIAESEGVLYVAGRVTGAVDIGGGPLPVSPGALAAIVAAYRAEDGMLMWAKSFARAVGRDVAVNSDTVVATGYFEGTLDLDGTVLETAGGQDSWVASWDLAGIQRWAVRSGGTMDDVGNGVGINADPGDVVSGGRQSVSDDFQAFVRRHRPTNGTERQPPRFFGGDGADIMNDVDMEASTACTTGSITGPTDFGSGYMHTPLIGSDAFVACFVVVGDETRWARGFDIEMTTVGRAVAVTPEAVWGGGYFTGEADFGFDTEPVTSQGMRDGYAIHLDLIDGTTRRVFSVGGPAQDEINAVFPHDDGAFAVGWFEETARFGDEMRTARGQRDAFIVFFE